MLDIVPIRDNKIVVDTLAENEGRVQFVATVSRSPRARVKRQLFQPLALVDIIAEGKANASLRVVKDASVAVPLVSVPFNPYKLSIALFVADFLKMALRGQQADPLIYKYVESSIMWLDGAEAGFANFHLVFMMRLSRFIGFLPNLEDYAEGCYFDLAGGCFCAMPPMHRDFLQPHEASRINALMRMSYETMRLFAMSRAERNRCVEVILDFYRLHVPDFRELKSWEVLKRLFE